MVGSYPQTVSLLLHLLLPDYAFALQPAHLTILPSNRQEVGMGHHFINFIHMNVPQVRLGSNLVLTCMGHANTLELVRDLEWRLAEA